jgi:DNA mismatch repair protein MSH5
MDTPINRKVTFGQTPAQATETTERNEVWPSPLPNSQKKSIVAITKQKKVGIAHYSRETKTLSLMTTPEWDADILNQWEPTRLLTHARNDDGFLEVLKRFAVDVGVDVEVGLGGDFSLNQGQRRLLNVDTSKSKKHVYLWLGGRCDLDQELAVCAAGAVLAHVERLGWTVENVEETSPQRFMHVSSDAFAALNIFSPKVHPNSFTCKVGGGLDLWQVVNHCTSPMGKHLLKQWFLRPSYDLETISERAEAVEILMHHPQVMQSLMDQMTKGNVWKWMGHLDAMQGYDWHRLAKFCSSVLACGQMLVSLPSNAYLNKVVGCNPGLATITASIADTLMDTGEVRSNVDAVLDDLRRTMNGLDHLLTTVARDLIQEGYPRDLSVVYFPQLGFLTAVPSGLPSGGLNLPLVDWHLSFSTAQMCFYKTSRMLALDSELGDVQAMIQDREIDILQRLMEWVHERREWVLQACDAMAGLECLLSFAQASVKHNWNRAVFVSEDVLEVDLGRHALQELMLDVFVANSYEIDKPMLLMGPNASGKSCLLKQMGLVVYLAHVGCPVPAKTCRLGLVDRLLTRMQSKETVSKITSPFVNDLQQVARILNQATPKSVILMDEFGKGTTPIDGVALLGAVLAELRGRVVAVSHFVELVDLIELDCWTMQTMEDVCLYKLVKGFGESHAGRVARLAGICVT